MKIKDRFSVACGGLVLALASGCWTPSYYVEVYLSPQLKDTYRVYPSVEVDLIGADKNDAERLESCDIDEYFDVDDPLRKSTPHATLHFTETDIMPKQLSTWDDAWYVFEDKEADQLYVMVNLPKVPPKPGSKKSASGKDGRRIKLPLEPKNPILMTIWPFYYRTRVLEITPVGVNSLGSAPKGAAKPITEYSNLGE